MYLGTKLNPKERQCQKCSNYHTIALISHASKVMLKILQTRLQLYMNWELPDVQAGLRKGRGARHQIANIILIIEKSREFQKNIYFCFIDYPKAFNSVEVKRSEVTQSCLTLCDPTDCSLQGSSVHGIFHARVQEWVAISFSRGSSQPRDPGSGIAGRRFTVWATKEVPLTLWITTNYGTYLKRWVYQTTLSISWETCVWVKK